MAHGPADLSSASYPRLAAAALALAAGCAGVPICSVATPPRADPASSEPQRGPSSPPPACCWKRGNTQDGCLEATPVQVPRSDGSGLGEVRFVMRDGGKRRVWWGLADVDGKILVEPGPGWSTALSTRVLSRELGQVRILSPDLPVRTFPALHRVDFRGAPPLYLVSTSDAQGRKGLAPLRPDGSLGAVLPGADLWNLEVSSQTALLQLELPGGRGSAIIDVTGQPLVLGGEIRRYCVPQEEYVTAPIIQTYMQVGRSPVPLRSQDSAMYLPVVDGQIARRADGVLGIVPLFIFPHPTSSNAPPIVGQWLIVEQGPDRPRYRVARGSQVLDQIAASDAARTYDEVTMVLRPSIFGPEVPHTIVHRPKEGDWMSDPLSDTPGHGATAHAAFLDHLVRAEQAFNARQAAAARSEAERKERERVEAAAQAAKIAAARAKARSFWLRYAPQLEGTCPPGADCQRLEQAAFSLGDPHLTTWLRSQHSLYGGTALVREACAASHSACQEARRIDELMAERALAERIARRQRAQAQEAALKSFAAGAGVQVRVNYYEDGRLKQRTMSLEDYRNR